MAKSELRRDLITKRWVAIATERSKRPSDFGVSKKVQGDCVFCPGHEDKTPPEILVYRKEGTLSWKVRVVPNLYGAFDIDVELEKEKNGVLRKMNARGAHEVIISTDNHTKSIYAFSVEEMNDLLWACKDRMRDLAKAVNGNNEPKIDYIIIFGNQGESAGASKEHAHWQLVGLPVVPIAVWNEIESGREYWAKEDECVFCKLTGQERESQIRIVSQNEGFLSLCQYAGRFPFETWVLPQNHRPLFEDGSPKIIFSLAEILVDTIKRMGKILKNPDFNLHFHSAPVHDRQHDRYFHFHVEILPRLTKEAGFEYGTGFYINPTSPEEAAKCLREAEL